MFQKKLMHPRNIYNTPPDFKTLAAKFPEFRNFVQVDLSGQVRFNFKNPDALRAFSRVLLKKDFNLDVTIPSNTLIPTVPLRLNYVLWLEDLLSLRNSEECIKGIDIGTGASCVYPLIIVRKNQWKMMATEKDALNLNCARGNVERNKLAHLIQVKHVTGTTILEEILSDTPEQFDFCMCNPPFFGDFQEISSLHKARKKDRNPPRNALSCTPVEVITEGGEVEFIKKLIQESVTYKDRIKYLFNANFEYVLKKLYFRIFSSMVGIKRSLKSLKELLSNTRGVTSFKQTEFIQGHTTRWGLAWTFSEINLSEVPDYTCDWKKQSPKMFSHTFNSCDFNINEAAEKLQNIFISLQIKCTVMKKNDSSITYNISAYSNTWTHCRRKRREQKRHELDSRKLEEGNSEKRMCRNKESEVEEPGSARGSRGVKRQLEAMDNEESETKRLKIDPEKKRDDKYLEATVHVELESRTLTVQLIWVTGSAGKDTLHQILQYIINHLKIGT